MDVDKLEMLISKAEISYKSGGSAQAAKCAKKALGFLKEIDSDRICTHKVSRADIESKKIALRIFIARCYSKLGKFAESNKIYRKLLSERIYIAPVVFGLFYNHFAPVNADKMKLNLVLVKSCLLLP